MKQIHDVIIKPIVTEQSLRDASVGRYTFSVTKSSTKTDIKKAIESLFEVKVTKVATTITKGSKTRNTKTGKQTISYANKKARISLVSGQKIDIFDEHLETDDDKKKKAKKETRKAVQEQAKPDKKTETKKDEKKEKEGDKAED